jgi:hypothetical protein
LFDIPVRIASTASLLKLKEHAVAVLEDERAKHLADIELLKRNGA